MSKEQKFFKVSYTFLGHSGELIVMATCIEDAKYQVMDLPRDFLWKKILEKANPTVEVVSEVK